MSAFKTSILNIVLLYYLSRQHDILSTFRYMLVAVLGQGALWLFYQLVVYPRLLSPLRGLPEPKSSRYLTGESFNIAISPDMNNTRKWINETPNHGLIRFRTFWGIDSLMITSPDLLSEVLISKSYDYTKRPWIFKILVHLLGNGIVYAEGPEHKRQRKHLMPPFAYSRIKELYPTFWKHACEATMAISNTVKEENIVEINEWASRVMLDIIGEAGMGQSFHAISNPTKNDLFGAYSTIFSQPDRQQAKQIVKRLARDYLCLKAPYFEQWFPNDPNNPVVHSIRLIRRLVRDIIASSKLSIDPLEHRESRQQARINVIHAAVGSHAFSDEDLVNQMMTFLLAGHETSASALTMACYYLCKYPDMQDNLREEIRSNLPSPSTSHDLNADEIRNLPYLSSVCEEVLRLAPPVPTSGRIAVTDTYIGKQFVPKGTTIILPSAAINGSKEIWGEDALKFNPERWLDGSVPKSPFANMTFLHGPRSCMGKDFARGGFVCVLAAWVGRFAMEFKDPQFEPKFVKTTVTLKLDGGMDIKLKQLEGW